MNLELADSKINLQPYIDSSARVIRIEHDSLIFWLKKSASPPPRCYYAILSFISKMCKLDLLKPVVKYGGKTSLDIENKRLKELALAGVKVPKIIQKSDDWILLTDTGTSLRDKLRSVDISVKEKLLHTQNAAKAIVNLHSKQHYLSQAFAKNITIQGNSVSFIDFEDDPATVFNRTQAQTRDILFFLVSTYQYLFKNKQDYLNAISLLLNSLSKDVTNELKQLAQQLNWLTRLPFKKHLGTDYIRLYRLITLINEPKFLPHP